VRSSLLLAVVGAFALGACSGAPVDEPEQTEDALNKTIPIDKPLPVGFDKDFERTFSHTFRQRVGAVEATVRAKIHFDVTGAKLQGSVVVGERHHRPTILTANLNAHAQYSASVEVDLEVRGRTEVLRHDPEDLEESPLGGASMDVLKNFLPLNIPLSGPLFLHTHFDVGLACAIEEIEGHARISAGSGVEGGVDLKLRYDREHFRSEGPEAPTRFHFDTSAPGFTIKRTPTRFSGVAGHMKASCALQPTLVVLMEHAVGAKLIVAPYVELGAKRDPQTGWSFSTGAGVEGYAQTDVELFGHALLKPKEFPLFDRKFLGP
jgi:hypothetical protein